MYAWLLRILLRGYPRSWRERYGQELAETAMTLDARRERSRSAVVAGVLAGGAEAWIEIVFARKARAKLGLGGAATALIAAAAIVLSAGTAAPRNLGAGRPDTTAQLQANAVVACDGLARGRRATVVEMNPTTGRILGRAVVRCSGHP